MPATPDTSPTPDFEGKPKEYDPMKDPVMHRVAVKDEIENIGEVEYLGYKTAIPGAKVDLQALAEYIKTRQGLDAQFATAYFTTSSGTIYRLRNLPDGTWEVENSRRPTRNSIQEACTIEVGHRFTSPHLIEGKPALDTSPVQDITLVDTGRIGIEHGRETLEETDVAKSFTHAVRDRETS